MANQETPRPQTLAELFESSTTRFADRPVSMYSDGTCVLKYSEFRTKALMLSELMTSHGIGAGQRVAIISENMPHWLVAMFSAVAFGRVMVPVLPDCSANEIRNILTHSESKVAFVSSKQLAKIGEDLKEKLNLMINLETLEVLQSKADAASDGAVVTPQADSLAAILYTSGTSGNAKGVMLSHRNIIHNVNIAPGVIKLTSKDTFLSILPAAHTYELSLGEVFPFSMGAKVSYLKGAPTPSVLLKALKQVRPTAVASVPLIIEKIYRKSVLVTIQKNSTLSWMRDNTPALLYLIIGLKLKKTFGGRLRIFAIGGAKLDSEVESFLKQAHFPYAIGYGMTETAPLIAAAPVGKTVVGSTGWAMEGVTIKLLNTRNDNGLGEIVVKGPNVMMGYYKDPERTKEAFTEDGWLHTKDLAAVDSKGRYFIKGRLGNMILGASGENIYPEEIEEVINGIENVEESIVKSSEGKLVALVKMADGVLDWSHDGEEGFRTIVENMQNDIRNKTNANVSKASQIASVILVREAFEKTATKKIRRFLYI